MSRSLALLAAFAFATAAAAAPPNEKAAPRPLTDAVIQGVWSRCPSAKVVRDGAGAFTVTGPDRVVGVTGADSCSVHQPEKGPLEIKIHFGLSVTDPTSGEELASLQRNHTSTEAKSCDDARAEALKNNFASANPFICTEGFHPLEPEPVDLAVLLQPTFSAAGNFAVGGEEGIAWRVNGHDLAIVGEATCGLSTRSLESDILSQVMRSWVVKQRYDLTEPAKKERLKSFNYQTMLIGITCDKAMASSKNSIQRDVKKAFAEAQKVLPSADTP